MERIEPELLISLVQGRPGLWDKSADCHKDVVHRSNAWKDICRIFNPEFDNLNRRDKNACVKAVMKKWTNIRDAWRKTVTEDKRKFKPYIYHEQLKFLKKNLNYKKQECSDGDAHRDKPDHDSDDADDSLATFARQQRRSRAADDVRDNGLVHFMDVKHASSDEPHISFFRGLLPTLNKLDDDETLEFQAGVIRLLQEVRKKGRDSEPYQYYGVATSSYDMQDSKKHMSE